LTPTETGIAAAFTLGFLGSSHCLVMCGGIGAALGMGAAPERRFTNVLLFQVGRVATYTLLGAGLGALIASVAGLQAQVLPALRIVSGLLLVAMGCYVARWWVGLTLLERAGTRLWRVVEPAAQRRLPIGSRRDALIVGMFWGFLPCGLIYTALAWTATAADWRQSALLMAVFGLGTVPAMLATGLAAERIARLLGAREFRTGAALMLIAAGLWTAWIGYQHAGHLGHGPALPHGNEEPGEPPAHQHHPG
jgi:sulfite exporter TauE/SafE